MQLCHFLCMPLDHAAASFASMILSACGDVRDKGVAHSALAKIIEVQSRLDTDPAACIKSGRRMHRRLVVEDIYVL